MTIECPKCGSKAWEATGQRWTSRRNLPRAMLQCRHCGERYSSGLPEALEAAAVKGDAILPGAVPVPTPSLPLPVIRRHDFVKVGDVKMRQLPREPGEDG